AGRDLARLHGRGGREPAGARLPAAQLQPVQRLSARRLLVLPLAAPAARGHASAAATARRSAASPSSASTGGPPPAPAGPPTGRGPRRFPPSLIARTMPAWSGHLTTPADGRRPSGSTAPTTSSTTGSCSPTRSSARSGEPA